MQDTTVAIGLGTNRGAPATNIPLTSRSDRGIIMKGLNISTDQPGGLASLKVGTVEMLWNENPGQNTFPIEVFGPGSALYMYNDAGIFLADGNSVSLEAILAAAGTIQAQWGADDATPQQLAIFEQLEAQKRPPGRDNWLFGMGRNSIGAGATVDVTVRSARAAAELGELVCTLDTVVGPGDVELVDILIQNRSQLPNNISFDLGLFQPANFNRSGYYIGGPIPRSAPVTLRLRNNTAGAIVAHPGFIASPKKGMRFQRGMMYLNGRPYAGQAQ